MPGDRMSTTINDLIPDTNYFFKMQAINEKGYGPVSEVKRYRTPKADDYGRPPPNDKADSPNILPNDLRSSNPADENQLSPKSKGPGSTGEGKFSEDNGISTKAVIVIAIGIVIGITIVAIVAVAVCLCRRHMRTRGYEHFD